MTATAVLPIRAGDECTSGGSPPDALCVNLVRLGIRPFEPDSVAVYKATQVEKHSGRFGFDRRRFGENSVAFAGALYIATLFCGILFASVPHVGHEAWYLAAGATVLGLVSLIVAIAATLIAVLCMLDFITRSSARWLDLGYDTYHGGVPAGVRTIAQRIRDEIPEADLRVHELRVNKQPVDPFLVVRHDGEEWAVEVWDEGGFVVAPNPV